MKPENDSVPPKVFISYSHDSDGHAERVLGLADRLRDQGVDAHLDQYEAAPKEGWPRWMARQIKQADFVLLVCTAAYYRRVMGKEQPGTGQGATWEGHLILQAIYEADSVNEKFIPVLFKGGRKGDIPDPLRPFTHHRVDAKGGYDQLYRRLTDQHATPMRPLGKLKRLPPRRRAQRPATTAGAPVKPDHPIFMPEGLPPEFVQRAGEFGRLLEHLLREDRQAPTAITAALRGAGGYGKTILARAICHDPRIREAFPDGILWVTLGERPNVVNALTKLYATLTGDRPGFVDEDDGAVALAEAWGDGSYLLVIDDVWSPAHLRPFLRGGGRCARLITTRDTATLPPDARKVDVDAMRQTEAEALLSAGLPTGGAGSIRDLAGRLGNWALLLRLVNGALRHRVETAHQSLADALTYVNRALDQRGLTAFDARNPAQREQAVARTVGVSLEALSEAERARYLELGIFPEDVDIPRPVLARLWGATGHLSDFDTDELCGRLARLSLLSHYDAGAGLLRLHDVFRNYLRDQLGERLSAVHRALLDACKPTVRAERRAISSNRWKNLPDDDKYLWRYVSYHLSEAGDAVELRDLLLDFAWLQAKLDATDPPALVADFDFAPQDKAAKQVQGAIRLSAHVVAGDKGQFAGQLLGRLGADEEPEIKALLTRAQKSVKGPWLRPLTPSLTLPGGPLLATLSGHTGGVLACQVTSDGRRVVSGSGDATLKVWDLESGQEVATLSGHTNAVMACAVTPDGRRLVSGSWDSTLKVWGMESGQELGTLSGHTDGVLACAVTPDARRVVSGCRDNTLKVWHLQNGQELLTLSGHTGWVRACAVTPDGRRVVSASFDHTLKVWDLESGQELATLSGHTDLVKACAVTPDGRRVVSGSVDDTLKVWNLESGAELPTLSGHTAWVRACAVTPDGRRLVSGSDDHTLKVWDLGSAQELGTLSAHTNGVRACAVTPDGRRVVSGSGDNTLKVWDLASGQELATLSGHTSWVNACAVTPDGRRVVSGSYDNTLKVWDLASGQELATLAGHGAMVNACAVTPDGRRVVSGSDDGTLKVWDLESGKEVDTLAGHRAMVNACAVTPDGRRVVSGSVDHTLKVWDLESGRCEGTLEACKGAVHTGAVTPDGRRVVSGSSDNTLKVWDLESRSVVATFTADGAIHAVAVGPDGRTIVAGDAAGRVHFLRLEGDE